MYEERTYRGKVRAEDLVPFKVVVKQTDLFVLAEKDLSGLATRVVMDVRHQLESYIKVHPEFLSSLSPLKAKPGAPEVVRRMVSGSTPAGVGPMAAVAGTVAEMVGEALLEESSQAIVENGGDVFIKTTRPRIVSIYAGDSPISEKVGIRVKPEDTPVAVCASSGRIGHSLSLGAAHAACIIAKSAALADAAATAVGNAVKDSGDVEKGLAAARAIKGVLGAVIVADDKMGAWGKIELVKL